MTNVNSSLIQLCPLSVIYLCLLFSIVYYFPLTVIYVIGHCLSLFIISCLSPPPHYKCVIPQCLTLPVSVIRTVCHFPLSIISHCLSFPIVYHFPLSHISLFYHFPLLPPLYVIFIVCHSPIICYSPLSCHFLLSVIHYLSFYTTLFSIISHCLTIPCYLLQ